MLNSPWWGGSDRGNARFGRARRGDALQGAGGASLLYSRLGVVILAGQGAAQPRGSGSWLGTAGRGRTRLPFLYSGHGAAGYVHRLGRTGQGEAEHGSPKSRQGKGRARRGPTSLGRAPRAKTSLGPAGQCGAWLPQTWLFSARQDWTRHGRSRLGLPGLVGAWQGSSRLPFSTHGLARCVPAVRCVARQDKAPLLLVWLLMVRSGLAGHGEAPLHQVWLDGMDEVGPGLAMLPWARRCGTRRGEDRLASPRHRRNWQGRAGLGLTGPGCFQARHGSPRQVLGGAGRRQARSWFGSPIQGPARRDVARQDRHGEARLPVAWLGAGVVRRGVPTRGTTRSDPVWQDVTWWGGARQGSPSLQVRSRQIVGGARHRRGPARLPYSGSGHDPIWHRLARHGSPRHDRTGLVSAGRGNAPHGTVGRGSPWHGVVLLGWAPQDPAPLGSVWLGTARLPCSRPGIARPGMTGLGSGSAGLGVARLHLPYSRRGSAWRVQAEAPHGKTGLGSPIRGQAIGSTRLGPALPGMASLLPASRGMSGSAWPGLTWLPRAGRGMTRHEQDWARWAGPGGAWLPVLWHGAARSGEARQGSPRPGRALAVLDAAGHGSPRRDRLDATWRGQAWHCLSSLGKAGPGSPIHGKVAVGRGAARQGTAPRGGIRLDGTRHGSPRCGCSRRGWSRLCVVRQVNAGRGWSWRGSPRQDPARRCVAGHGKAPPSRQGQSRSG